MSFAMSSDPGAVMKQAAARCPAASGTNGRSQIVYRPSTPDAMLANPATMIHWAVSETTGWDSLMAEGSTNVVDDTPGRTVLWDRLGYDLSPFEPGWIVGKNATKNSASLDF